MDQKDGASVNADDKSSSSSSLILSSMKKPGEKYSNDLQYPFIWRAVNLVMAVFLLLAAYVQINDPDPYIWIPVYLVPALLSLTIVIRPSASEYPIWRNVCVVHIALCVIGSIYLLSVVFELLSTGSASFLVYEEAREFLGIVIVIIWLSICRFSSFAGSPNVGKKKGWLSALLTMSCVVGVFPLVFWSMCFIGPLSAQLDHCQEMHSVLHHS